MEKIFIISRYHAEKENELVFNINLAKAMARKICLEEGRLPIAPHLYFTGFLKDKGHERGFGILAGHELMKGCKRAVVLKVDGIISEGMAQDLEQAGRFGIPVKELEFSRTDAERFIRENLQM